MLNFMCEQFLPGKQSLPLRDVAGDLGRSDHPPCHVLHRGYGERYVDQASILTSANGLIVIDAFSASDTLKDPEFLVTTLWGDEDRYWRTDHFLGRIAEDSLRSVVPGGDDAIEVLAYDRIP